MMIYEDLVSQSGNCRYVDNCFSIPKSRDWGLLNLGLWDWKCGYCSPYILHCFYVQHVQTILVIFPQHQT